MVRLESDARFSVLTDSLYVILAPLVSPGPSSSLPRSYESSRETNSIIPLCQVKMSLTEPLLRLDAQPVLLRLQQLPVHSDLHVQGGLNLRQSNDNYEYPSIMFTVFVT